MNLRLYAVRLALFAGALTALMAAPREASAQASALFPDIYIKRQRPCPEHEDPRYQYIRENYYGYFPTCWRRFPPGWGCPSADAPNWEAELRRMPLQEPEDLFGSGTSEREGAGARPREDDPFRRPAREPDAMPALPPDEDPFTGQPRGARTPETPPAINNRPNPLDLPRPDIDSASTRMPAAADPRRDAVAPPLAPPTSANGFDIPAALPNLPTTSVTDGIAPPSNGGRPANQRRGPIAGAIGRVLRR